MPSVHPAAPPLGLLVRRWPERRPLLLGSAVVLFVTVFASVVLADDASLGLAFLAVVPIVLVALELGQRGGIAVASIAFAVVVAAAALGHPVMDSVAVAVRGSLFLTVGTVAGHFSDRMRATHLREDRLLRSGLRLSAVNTPERLRQAVVSEALSMPGVHAAEVTVDGVSLAGGQARHGLRSSAAMQAHGVDLGRIEAFHDAPLSAEDGAAFELLARQSALTAENLRLLGLDRERAALEVRLREVRRELLESRSGAGVLLQAEEDEKRRLAGKLHEDLAQVLAAVLLGIRMLERRSADGSAAHLQQLHDQVAEVLAEVREVARELRPVVLDQLGLRAAVATLGLAAEERGADVLVDVGSVPRELPEDVETAVFRLVEHALDSTDGGRLRASIEEADGALRIGIAMQRPDPAVLLALRTRAESLGGSTQVVPPDGRGMTQLRVTLPIA